ncbi:bifunctional (p)ppGpp synthetase/guanosine-3',5'-bis(diphosphate) 3'-pyrophosphohydrolase [Sutcliffiella horikoshii]|uniref:Bifunctional (P)ppGpp synthetase/guanosine-3',5'-bis(Diphosphate) 3'-pyrophosphohydrolase n=1 Tax=Sutcliffiella horikoshii TaxID=79883 RepID=A0A5D4SK27_9BACI|nr:HD domain-containing protein [Sutcliffiella horikoshii]TYS62512.1 bifunctional (p)ppGpp synthetase/guanosine-3',5'-bis(diphosphate) 3'-pyrophosphohydrolase [Sutcliffiella horikoshii]
MKLVEKAIIFAAMAHKNQTRKGTETPYVTHPFAVGMMLQGAGCSEEVVAAGILHDTLEDTEATYDSLVKEFGAPVANLVVAASENDKSLSWEDRKQHTIDGLKDASMDELQVIVADKLHNLRSIRTDLEEHGEVIWGRFNRGKQKQHWYYASIVKALAPRKDAFKLIGELEKEVRKVFGFVEL